MSFLDDTKNLPSNSGIYQMLDQQGNILYIGKAKNIKKRVLSYTKTAQLPLRLKRMVSLIASISVVITETETEALLLECNLIKRHRPPYNILLKDDKSFPYILLTRDHDFPRLVKHRGKQTIKGDYFGPFAAPEAVDETLIHLQKIFRLRTCTDSFFSARKKPCLQYHLKRCSAPCVGFINEENYKESVSQAIQFLKGKTDIIQTYIAERMQQASNLLDFERAAVYRDRLKLIAKIQSHQRINIPEIEEADVIGIHREHKKICIQIFIFRFGRHLGNIPFILDLSEDEDFSEFLETFLAQFYEERHAPPFIFLNHLPTHQKTLQEALKTTFFIPKQGAKKQLIDHAYINAQEALRQYLAKNASMKKIFLEIKELFCLNALPKRIEVYDNTHHQGESAYSVMVVANEEGFDKKQYRKFTMDTNDDYAMMRSVMQRRFSHTDWEKPDFIIIDGGLGQLNAVQSTLHALDLEIPCVAMSKGPDRRPGEEKYIVSESTQVTPSPTLSYFLQRLRDEAHRFAIGTHRASHKKKLHKSTLDPIPGIGPKRKKCLLQHFGSAHLVSQAALQDLENVPGIDKIVAQKIYDFFRKK